MNFSNTVENRPGYQMFRNPYYTNGGKGGDIFSLVITTSLDHKTLVLIVTGNAIQG